jgi:hypothetical protein
MRYLGTLLIAVFYFLGTLSFVSGQQTPIQGELKERILTDKALIGISVPLEAEPVSAKTASQTLLLPFFDDFSYEALFPDTTLWMPDTQRQPYISRTMPISPPSLGVAVFDGSNSRGSYYSLPGPNPPFPEGFADMLTSRPIDLSAYGPGDSIRLSFVYQPKGLGNEPEFGDSLIVYFRDTSTTVSRFIKVWGIPGSPFHDFRNVLIPVQDSLFLHDHFQFRIRNKATLSGQLDHWMVDYVFLEANRNKGDTIFDDQALTEPTPPIFFPYTHLSQKQFTALWWERFRNFGVSMRNLGSATASRTLVTNISELKHNAFLSGTVSYNLPVNLGAGPQVRAFTAFDNQPFFDYMMLRHTTLLDLPDSRPLNDTCRVDYPIDSLFAYDDGTPEAAYGLNTARVFAQRFETLTEDSIYAVQLCFIKTIYNIDIPRSFVLTIYDGDQLPGTILYEQFGSALAGDSLNQFYKMTLDSGVPVGRSFWVGIRQTDPEPIGIGIDYNNFNTRVMWDSLQTWVGSNLQGTLMMRLNLSKGNPVPFFLNESPTSVNGDLSIWPNPAGSEMLWWKHSGERNGDILIYDALGQLVFQSTYEGQTGQFQLPFLPASGVYKVIFKGRTGGFYQSQSCRIP